MHPTGRGYGLRCCGCGSILEDDGVRLDCPREHAPALLRSLYPRAFRVDDVPSMLRYRAWLPRGREVAVASRTAVYRSSALGGYLGLPNLWVAFSGWWPQRGATLATATFKELEAYAVLSRLDPDERRTLVVASAGNTAAAFARAATELETPALIVIPLCAWERLSSLVRIGPTVRVVAIEGGQYEDAIALSRRIGTQPEYVLEGGVRNVGRRDGMGTAMLEAVEAIGALPDAYVQGVGSGAGALAAHEAALRLVDDGRFGTQLPQLLLGQNAPFTPIHDAWQRRSSSLGKLDQLAARTQIGQMAASVLSNLAPPYGTAGGVHDALAASDGRTYAVSNDEVAAALELFAQFEGIDIEPAAGVALGALLQGLRAGDVSHEARVLLHITGGGAAQRELVRVDQCPALIVACGEPLESARVA